MESKEYVKEYCAGDWEVFNARIREGQIVERDFRWGAYEAYTTLLDIARDITIEHTTYLGED